MADDVPSDSVLDDVASRSVAFLGGVSRNRGIRAVLSLRGYTQDDHERGWQLTFKASGYRRPAPVILESPAAVEAIAAIDKWDEPTFRIARAALVGAFKEQHDFVFQDLTAQTGAASVVSVTTFLDRLDALESGEDRKATRKVDQAALKKLTARGITKEERTRMRDLLVIARGPSAETTPAPEAEDDDSIEEQIREAKIELWRWYAEWAEIARADIRRRDWLIVLGLAKRKQAKKGDDAKGGGDK
ncbi:Hypothetical protein A7982_02372 [Minicystis rosea]|nr:Hypothetical protein A7982_02372 [Minicystis rosea]